MRLSLQYSKEDFIAEYTSDPTSRHLADALAVDVQEILHEAVTSAVSQIVQHLNARGHDLRNYEPPAPGVIALRDDAGEGANYRCDLRLAIDTVVSVGFRDTVEENQGKTGTS